MDTRKLMLMAGALLFAGIAAVFARSMFAASTPAQAAVAPAPVVSGTEVLVATKPLPVGTIVTPEHVSFRPWPKEMIDGAYFVKGAADASSIAGRVVRVAMTPGQPITQGALVGPGERGFLAAALGPGMRAVTVAVSDASGVGGFVFPGDRIDLVLTQEVTGDGRSLKASETFVRDVRVLAVDQSTESKEAKVGRTVTLEATPKIAEKIAVGSTIGTLTLSLRSLADTPEQLAALQSGQVKDIAHAPTDAETSVTTGAEVSRFQRSNVPPQSGGGGGSSAPAPAASSPKVVRPAGPRVPSVNVFRGGASGMASAPPAMGAAMAAGTL